MAQREYNRYVILVTSITNAESSEILELYRQRWQIEMVFKRLKSLFKACQSNAQICDGFASEIVIYLICLTAYQVYDAEARKRKLYYYTTSIEGDCAIYGDYAAKTRKDAGNADLFQKSALP